jgi:pimeloyl-ACP methyl ester carboxylesterase
MRQPRWPAVILVLLAACANTRGKLPPLEEVDDLWQLSRAAAALPNATGFVEVGKVDGQPIKLYFRHTRAKESQGTVVLLHGLLSDSRAWDLVLGDLGRDHDVLLIDLMGCGKSDKPDPDDIGEQGYSPTALARQVLEVTRERTKDRRVTVVGHSLGGMVILRMLGAPALRREYKDVVRRIEHAVLVSTPSFAVERVHPTFEEIAGLSDIAVALADVFEVLGERVARSVYYGAGDPSRMPRGEADRAEGALRRRATRRAAQAMIRQAVPFTKQRRPDWDKIDRLVADYRNVDVPCLILWGARDETFSVAVGHMLRDQLPQAELRILPRRMHQLPVEAPRDCASYIRRFVAGEIALMNGPDTRPPEVDAGAVAAVLMRAMKPGEGHKRLEHLAGEWDRAIRFRFAPWLSWVEEKGPATTKWILGGRFLQERVQGGSGLYQKFESLGFVGYDSVKKRYILIRMDNELTSPVIAEGDFDATGKKLNFRANALNPLLGRIVPIRIVYTLESEDSYNVGHYLRGEGGKEFRWMDVTYTRRQKVG